MLGHRKLVADDYVAILKRRRWLILTPLLLLPLITYGVSFLIPAEYVSSSLILVEEKKVPDALVASIITQGLSGRLAAMRETALSRSRLEPIIQKYNLYPSKHLTMDDRIEQTRKAIAILPIKSEINRANGLPGFTISFKGDDPRTSQQVCQDVTGLFITQNLQNRQAAANETTDFLRKQLDDAKATLDDQDSKLAQFQQQHIGGLPSGAENNGNLLNSLSTQLAAANQALASAEQQKDFNSSLLAQELQNAPIVPTANGPAPAATLQADQQELQSLQAREADLLTTHTESYPDVIQIKRKISDLKKKIAATASPSSPAAVAELKRVETPEIMQLRAKVRAADTEIRNRQQEQAQIQRGLNEYRARIEASPLLEEKYKELNRGYETARKIYDGLLEKVQNAKEATDLERAQEAEQFTVMDGANLPDEPTFPKRWMFALGGVVLGLALGLGLAAFLEYRDTVLRSEADVWAFTRLPTLAVIAYSGALVVPQARPTLLARVKNLFSSKRSTDIGQDPFGNATT